MSELTPVEREYLERTRIASGVPVKVEDPATIRLLAAMLTTPKVEKPKRAGKSWRTCHDCYRWGEYGYLGTDRVYCKQHFDKRLRRATGLRSVHEELRYELNRTAARAMVTKTVQRLNSRRRTTPTNAARTP